jgi:hypothetical protein
VNRRAGERGETAPSVFGTGPNSWIPERLERRFALTVRGSPVLGAPGHTREKVDWSDFNVVAETDVTSAETATTRKRVPTRRRTTSRA